MTRRAGIRLVLAALVLLAAVWAWRPYVPQIDRPGAEARAARMLSAYIQQTGEPPVHFTSRRMMTYPDGWEFSWVYRPCADAAELRIFIATTGAATYSQLPDCAPTRGFAVRPQRV